MRLLQGNYEPGKRHWLKVKKDYLNEGAMADTADLVVLGGFYGKGSNGTLWCCLNAKDRFLIKYNNSAFPSMSCS